MITDVAAADVIVISDLHLGSPASTAAGRITKFLDYVADTGAALCINGD
jgi:UDP-2,3-diacylglucosamine pyrophosphatase LpxH